MNKVNVPNPLGLQFFGTDLDSLIVARARDRGTHPFLVWAPFDSPVTTWSYARFADEVAQIAGGLAARGVRKRDRVLVHLENCPETLLSLFACARLGAVCVPTNAMAAGPELAWYSDFAGAVGAITQPKFARLLLEHCRGLKWLAVTATDAGTPVAAVAAPDTSIAFASLYGKPAPARPPDPMAPALIMFTTGTTSYPKAVLWTHANALWGGKLGALQQALRAEDVYHIFLPLYHVVALSWSFLPALWAGATVVLQPRFSASRFWPAALEHRATVGSQVTYTIKVLASQPVPAAHHFRQWTESQCLHDFESHFRVKFVAGWGMTEVIAQGIVGDPWSAQRSGCIGRPSPAYRLRIEDDEGRLIAPGGSGQLLIKGVRGVSIFAEYVDNPQATAAAFDEHGYFRTGDRVILHEDGFIQFGDRLKDMIKVGGEGVSAAEVERIVLSVAGVKEAAVVAKSDPNYGELPVAFIVVSPEAAASSEIVGRVVERCRESLARFKVPREVITIPELPRVGFGKIAKAQLREWLRSRT